VNPTNHEAVIADVVAVRRWGYYRTTSCGQQRDPHQGAPHLRRSDRLHHVPPCWHPRRHDHLTGRSCHPQKKRKEKLRVHWKMNVHTRTENKEKGTRGRANIFDQVPRPSSRMSRGPSIGSVTQILRSSSEFASRHGKILPACQGIGVEGKHPKTQPMVYDPDSEGCDKITSPTKSDEKEMLYEISKWTESSRISSSTCVM
jgi:hypothetical protein